jgi:hypothetical protein
MKKISILLTVLLLCRYSFSQTLVQPGDGTLSAAIEQANDGDVLQLVPGGEYTESTNSSFGTLHKAITIELVDPTDANRAILTETINDGTSTPNFFFIGDSGSITLSGIEFDGSQNGTAAASHLVQITVGSTTDSGFVHKIKLVNCLVRDLTGNVIDGGSSSIKGIMIVDSIIVDNCIFHDTFTSVYIKYAGCDYIKVTNSTFYNIDSYGLRVAGPGESSIPNHTAAADIDHTTWYNIGISDPREIILLEKGPNLNPWTVSNSIFVDQTSDSKTVVNIKDLPDSVGMITNIDYWTVGPRKWANNIVGDTLMIDPQFADPANGNFTLPSGSQLLTFGTDGGPIGDPRWAGNATAVEDLNSLPQKFSLSQNYPNPFNPSTHIDFDLQKSGMTTLVVYNILGEKIATLINRNLTAGQHSVDFNASKLSSGVYIYQLNSSGKTISKKMILLK